MVTIEGHAVVMGASMAGLLAARTLSETHERVTVIDRDALPDGARHRRGVPQGRHVHALLPKGKELFEELFPGITDDLVAAGAIVCDLFGEARFAPAGEFLAHRSTGLQALQASRPLIEHRVRARIADLPNVRVIDLCDVVGLVTTDEQRRVAGVRVLPRADGSAPYDLACDLVVDATGRSSRVPSWLEDLGYEPPPEDHVHIGVGYASRLVRVDTDALNGDKFIAVGPHRGRSWGMAMMAIEDGCSLLTLCGYRGNHPPSDSDGFMRFAAQAAPPDVFDAIENAQPLDDRIAVHRLESNMRRRYEDLRRLPEALVTVGDAACSFNPIYGQGMTVAALEAVALRECVRASGPDLPRRFYAASARASSPAWDMTTGADLDLPEVDGPRPLRVRIVNGYMRRLLHGAASDPFLAEAFMRTAGMLDPPPALLRPRVLARVLRHAGPARHASRLTPAQGGGPGHSRLERPDHSWLRTAHRSGNTGLESVVRR